MSHSSYGYDGRNNYYERGLYNNYNYRPGDYANTRGSLCKNYVNYDGVVYGQFYCPIEGFNYDDTRCCGPHNEEYCCNEREYRMFNGDYRDEDRYHGRNDRHRKSSSGGSGLLVGFLVFTLFICMCCTLVTVFCCVKKRIYEKIPGILSSKNDEEINHDPKDTKEAKIETNNEEANKEPLIDEENKIEPNSTEA